MTADAYRGDSPDCPICWDEHTVYLETSTGRFFAEQCAACQEPGEPVRVYVCDHCGGAGFVEDRGIGNEFDPEAREIRCTRCQGTGYQGGRRG